MVLFAFGDVLVLFWRTFFLWLRLESICDARLDWADSGLGKSDVGLKRGEMRGKKGSSRASGK